MSKSVERRLKIQKSSPIMHLLSDEYGVVNEIIFIEGVDSDVDLREISLCIKEQYENLNRR